MKFTAKLLIFNRPGDWEMSLIRNVFAVITFNFFCSYLKADPYIRGLKMSTFLYK